jgi:hypothetical protein
MKKKSPLCRHYIIAFWVTLSVSIGLIIGGFFMPPKGEIDGSVMTSVGELFLWPALAFAAKAIEEGKVVSFNAGHASVNVGKDEDGDGLDDAYQNAQQEEDASD